MRREWLELEGASKQNTAITPPFCEFETIPTEESSGHGLWNVFASNTPTTIGEFHFGNDDEDDEQQQKISQFQFNSYSLNRREEIEMEKVGREDEEKGMS